MVPGKLPVPVRPTIWMIVGQGFGWLVGFGFNGPLRQYFSLYQAKEREKEERKDR